MWFKNLANLKKISYVITFFLAAIAVMGLQKNHYERVTTTRSKTEYLQQEKESLIALNLRTITPTFGFDNLVADSIYLEFIQYFGDEPARKATGYSLVPNYFAAIAERDPQFTEAYLTLSTANSMYAGKADKTIQLMDKVLRFNTNPARNPYLIWILKAADESIFLGDINAARYSYKKAAELALQQDSERASTIVASSQKRVQFLATKPDTTKTQIIAWKSVLPHVVKENEKQVIRDRIKALEAKLDHLSD